MPESIEISLARRRDAERIATMSRDLIETGLGWRWRPARVLSQIRCTDSNVIITKARTTVAGFGIMQYLNEDAHLLLLAVNPVYRRQGLGRRMVEWLEKPARVAGINRVHLEARARSSGTRAFYRALGYREAQFLPNYYYGREAAVRMVHELKVSA